MSSTSAGSTARRVPRACARPLASWLALAILATLAGCGLGGGSSAAASVNGQDISMSAYNVQVTYMRHDTQQSAADVDVCASKAYQPLCRKLKQTALNTLINEQLVQQYAQAHHISVSPAEFNRQWTIVWKGRFHSNSGVLRAYLKTTGISEANFKSMIRQDILQNEVMYQVTKTMPRSGPAVELSRILVANGQDLSTVQGQINNATSFNLTALRLTHTRGSLCAQQGCGELGWLPLALLPSGEEQIVTAPRGTVVGPIAGQAGYTLLLVENRAATYPYTADQDFALRERLFTEWLSRQERRSTVHRYVTA